MLYSSCFLGLSIIQRKERIIIINSMPFTRVGEGNPSYWSVAHTPLALCPHTLGIKYHRFAVKANINNYGTYFDIEAGGVRNLSLFHSPPEINTKLQ